MDETDIKVGTMSVCGQVTDVLFVRVVDVLGREREIELDVDTAVDLADLIAQAVV